MNVCDMCGKKVRTLYNDSDSYRFARVCKKCLALPVHTVHFLSVMHYFTDGATSASVFTFRLRGPTKQGIIRDMMLRHKQRQQTRNNKIQYWHYFPITDKQEQSFHEVYPLGLDTIGIDGLHSEPAYVDPMRTLWPILRKD